MSELGAAGSAEASARSAGWKSAADATLATATSAVTAKVLSFMIESAGRSVGCRSVGQVEYLLATLWCGSASRFVSE